MNMKKNKPSKKIELMRFAIAALVVLLSAPVQAEKLIGKASVIDGDTIELHGKKVRLYGIDAPESSQICKNKEGNIYRCGQLAARSLFDIIGKKTVSCIVKDKDRYNRFVAICSVQQTDLNNWIVAQGLALAYRKYSRDYVAAENSARASKLGLWQGEFVNPWDWRKGQRLIVKELDERPNCLIKGNISSSGKIYHTPSSRWYQTTKVDVSKGERWFCSEAEALAAGWRAPKK